MKFFVKSSTSGNWPEVKNFWVKTSETNPLWSGIRKAWVKVSTTDPGSWKMFWYNVIPKIEAEVTIVATTNSTTKEITLTGTNYYWKDADTLTYKIQKSTDNGATWPTILKSGTATNPSVGGSNTYTYVLLDNRSDVTPNVQNRYRFMVTATNTDSGGIGVSFADNEYVSGPENITIEEVSKTYNSVTISWNAAQHANKYLVYYKTSESSTFLYSKVISNTSTTIDSLLTYTAYDFKVIPITGVSLTNIGYRGNDSNILTVVTSTAPAPVQLTAPTINGTGYAFTAVNGTSGTYQSGTYKSKTVYIGQDTSAVLPTDGNSSPLPSAGSPPYTITQYDASAPGFNFYYVDAITANDNTVYYYYSSGVKAKIGVITDDFTRTVSSGLGYMTPAENSLVSPNSYGYNLSTYGSYWSVNGSVAEIGTAVTGTNSFNYPMQAVETGGNTNATIAASLPGGADGLGLVFWATNSGSWWASRVYRTSATSTKNVYYTTSTNCDTEGTQANQCRSAIENRLVCTAGQGTIANNCGVVTTCPQNSSGGQVTHCATRVVATCPENSTGTSSVKCATRILPTCPDNGTGSSTVKCKQRTEYSCPANGTGNNIVNCGVTVTNTCPANGTGSSGTNCNTRAVATCPANGTGSAGTKCATRIVSTSTCTTANGNGSTSSNCRTRVVYTCPSGQSYNGSGQCQSNSFPYAITGSTPTATSYYDTYVVTDTTYYDSAGSTTAYDKTVTTVRYDSTTSATAYDKSGTTTVYDKSTDATVYDLAVDTYSGNVSTPTTVYYTYGCTEGPTTQYDGTVPTNCLNTVSSVTVYNTSLNILKAQGGQVSIMDTTSLLEKEETPSPIQGISVTTSNNTIYTTIYADLARTTLLRYVSYIAISPTKSSAAGSTYYGIIKTPSGVSGGVHFDNLRIS